MKIVIIGGTGLIGSRLVQRLRTSGHDSAARLGTARLDRWLESGVSTR